MLELLQCIENSCIRFRCWHAKILPGMENLKEAVAKPPLCTLVSTNDMIVKRGETFLRDEYLCHCPALAMDERDCTQQCSITILITELQ